MHLAVRRLLSCTSLTASALALLLAANAAPSSAAEPAPAATAATAAKTATARNAAAAAPAAATDETDATDEIGEVEAPDPDPWPRVIDADKYVVKLFPPQVDSWEGNKLTAHLALEIVEKGKEIPVYGVLNFGARTRIDKDARLVVVDEFVALGANLPSAPQKEARLLGVMQQKLNDAMRVISLDRLEAAYAATEQARDRPQLAVANQAPRFVFAQKPTMLVLIDGEPVWRKIGDSGFERLANTRPLMVRDASGKTWLHCFDGYLVSQKGLEGPWKVSLKPSKPFEDAVTASLAVQNADLLDGGKVKEVDPNGQTVPKPSIHKGPIPDVIVVTSPTELVVFEGAPKWTPIPETTLSYAENTTGNVFQQKGDGYLVLVSGRWFHATSLGGPWQHVPQRSLAPDLAKIPDDSPKENVKASVAGTPQSKEALIADSIPQTAEIKVAEAKFTPQIDGEPQFAKIEGTPLSYVRNSTSPILKVSASEYFAVVNGVWFTAPAIAGPWKVASFVPDAIYSIPPASPLHYVTYVRIYAADDDTVVVGYTPGYYGTVQTDEVVVYGTGYDYEPWVGSYWYGYPATYGYGSCVTYAPWSGWAFTFGIGWAWGYWGSWYGPYYAPYWGAYGGYYPYYGGVVAGAGGGWAAWGPGGWAGTTGNIYQSWGSVGSVSRYSGGFNAWTGNAWRGQVGAAYNSRTGGIAAGQRGAVANVYTGGYAYGGRGVGRTGGGTAVAGGRVTMGQAGSGQEITAGRIGAYNPGTGQGGSAGYVRGDSGGVARVGDDYYGFNDGSVYKRNGQGDWSQVDRSGSWNNVNDRSRSSTLDRQYQGRSSGSQRYGGYRSSAPRGGGGRGGGGRRR